HFQELFRQPRRDPESRRRILPVGDHQIDLPVRNDVRQAIANDLPSRRADNVSHEKYAHALFRTAETQKWSGPLGRGELGCEPLNKVGATSQPLGFPAPLARLHRSCRDATRQPDRPCTRTVYPQRLRDSALVQTAFAPSPASKYRSTPIVSSVPKPRPTPVPLRRQKDYLHQGQSLAVESPSVIEGGIMRHSR